MWPLLENIGQLPRVSREAYGIDLTLTLKLKYLVLIWIYWHKNNRATSRHLSYLASPPQFESDSNVHQKNHRFRSQNFYPEVWRLQERRRIITLEQNTLSIFSHYDKTYPKHFIRSQQTTLTTHVFVTVVENSPQNISIRRGIGSLFEIKGFSSECVCQGNVVCDEEVVEINVIGHTPKLETNTTDWSHPERMGIFACTGRSKECTKVEICVVSCSWIFEEETPQSFKYSTLYTPRNVQPYLSS